MKKSLGITIALLAALLAFALLLQQNRKQSSVADHNAKPLQKVVVNEAARTLLYIPIYYALDAGYFRDAGLDVQIVTGGTATTAFAAMISGEAGFAVADPMYVPISQEKGGETRVVAQVVGRIAVWGVVKDPSLQVDSAASLRGRRIATHQKPMTAYTYTVQLLRDAGLDPDKDVTLVTGAPGSEIAALMAGQADVMFSLEPNTSRVVLQGGKIIYSFPEVLGDQIFTALMTKDSFVKQNRTMVENVVRALQRALNDLHADSDKGLPAGKKFFPQIEEPVLRAALRRIATENVLPQSVLVSNESWNKAVKVRIDAGDLKRAFTRDESCDVALMEQASR
jgi:NitT/TauT family transport system substrate-binding protein